MYNVVQVVVGFISGIGEHHYEREINDQNFLRKHRPVESCQEIWEGEAF